MAENKGKAGAAGKTTSTDADGGPEEKVDVKSARQVEQAVEAQGTPEGTIIKADGTIESGLFEATEDGDALVTAKEDVYEEFYFPNTNRPAYRLLYTAGQVVRKSELDRVNAARTGERSSVIDSTTIASGTRAPESAEGSEQK